MQSPTPCQEFGAVKEARNGVTGDCWLDTEVLGIVQFYSDALLNRNTTGKFISLFDTLNLDIISSMCFDIISIVCFS